MALICLALCDTLFQMSGVDDFNPIRTWIVQQSPANFKQNKQVILKLSEEEKKNTRWCHFSQVGSKRVEASLSYWPLQCNPHQLSSRFDSTSSTHASSQRRDVVKPKPKVLRRDETARKVVSDHLLKAAVIALALRTSDCSSSSFSRMCMAYDCDPGRGGLHMMPIASCPVTLGDRLIEQSLYNSSAIL